MILVVPQMQQNKGWALHAAEKLDRVKGTGFSPYINATK